MALNILSPGFLCSVQDRGRWGYQRFGVPVSGPMDRFAFAAANALVGNPTGAAAIELGPATAAFYTHEDCLVALTGGGGFTLRVDGKAMLPWMAVLVRAGSVMNIEKAPGGFWGYLGVSGGIKGEGVLGSQAAYVRGGFGAYLSEGEWLQVDQSRGGLVFRAGCFLPAGFRPQYTSAPTIEVILGPQEEYFTPEGVKTFLNSEYLVSATGDRMGYRLEGPGIEHKAGADIPSEGMVFGSVQVPASGQPIVMMSECPTTGGYTKIATVISADLPLLAQCIPGESRVRIRQTTVEHARERYLDLMKGLEKGIEIPDEDYPFEEGDYGMDGYSF